MKIVIIGTGDIGAFLCQTLSAAGNDVFAIEKDEAVAANVDATTDARVIVGDGCSAEMLSRIGAQDADYVLAMTQDDRTNLVSSSLAKALGARHVIARIHDQVYSETSFVNYQLHFDIDYFIQPEALCATEIAKLIRNPDRIAIEAFSHGNIEVQQIPISPDSSFINQPLAHLQIAPDVRLLYIIREGTLFLPTAETTLQAEDLATIVAHPETLLHVRERLSPTSVTEVQNVILFGGTETAIALARLLNQPRYNLHIIESNHSTCKQLAERFPKVKIIEGDGTSRKLLMDQQVEACDFFIACSKQDEHNIMTAIQAIQLGAKHTQIVIHRTDYEPVLNNLQATLGLNQAVSPRIIATQELLRYLSPEPYYERASLPNSSGKLWEIKVGYNSRAAGQLVRDLSLPKPSMIIALIHKFHATIPTATDRILGGDRLVIASKTSNLDEILNLFT